VKSSIIKTHQTAYKKAKLRIKEMDIVVNGEKENRRGRKLYPGDKVKIEGKTYVVF